MTPIDEPTPEAGGRGDVFAPVRDFFRGYLHEDLARVHGTAPAPMDAFIADASAADLFELARAWDALRKRVDPLGSDERLTMLRRLGLVWQPDSWDEIARLFEKLEFSTGADL